MATALSLCRLKSVYGILMDRRKTNDTMTVQTMCHLPELPLEGVESGLLQNSTSRECHMIQQQAVNEAMMMVCGCSGEHECNDQLIFNKRANGESNKGKLEG